MPNYFSTGTDRKSFLAYRNLRQIIVNFMFLKSLRDFTVQLFKLLNSLEQILTSNLCGELLMHMF